ncbi:ATP-binding protein [Methyloceanibacter sp.]|uniref:two-component system sensor histidine kinase NtrB n=1 Tax=Methyloceanibacter sp. TaxID=1965321 RepID=UPI002089C9C0|nr:ATP-binding protein [Methyloceanibacter sp.]GFO83512.1 MAG: two-component sensor histidine kinase [Methyloceanibacter sp.]HML92176.1 ATP-binding protein [Methyloceanibacter sp.]
MTLATKTSEAPRGDKHILCDALVDALPHPLLVIGKELSIDYANTAAEDFFQMSAGLLCRHSLPDVVAFGCPLIALVEQVQRNGTTVNEYGVELSSFRFESTKLVDLYGGPVPVPNGGVMVMVQQRSMAQMIERQLTHRGAARSVSGLAAVLAHEIKNPLSGIRGAAQLLEGERSESDRTLTQLICAESDRICKLVDRMEIFGDERPIQREPVNIHDVLDHVKHVASSGFARHIKIVEHYDPSLPPVPGSRDKLVQVFLNLVKNAAEAIGESRTDGQITLSTAFRPGVRLSVPGSQARVGLPLEIAVEDNGTGVPADLLQHLFDPFVSTKPSGTGLGLALVAKIVGDHGGIIECDSRPRYTVFRALMPMATGDTTAEPNETET